MKTSTADTEKSTARSSELRFAARNRYASLLYVLALLTWLVTGVAMECAADSSSSGDGEPSLQVILEKGLKARRPVEFKFIASVCDAVNRGDLPKSLAQRTFLWARRKNTRPFPYFQRAMEIQAAELGVSL